MNKIKKSVQVRREKNDVIITCESEELAEIVCKNTQKSLGNSLLLRALSRKAKKSLKE